MKKIIIFFLLLVSLVLYAEEKEIETDGDAISPNIGFFGGISQNYSLEMPSLLAYHGGLIYFLPEEFTTKIFRISYELEWSSFEKSEDNAASFAAHSKDRNFDGNIFYTGINILFELPFSYIKAGAGSAYWQIVVNREEEPLLKERIWSKYGEYEDFSDTFLPYFNIGFGLNLFVYGKLTTAIEVVSKISVSNFTQIKEYYFDNVIYLTVGVDI